MAACMLRLLSSTVADFQLQALLKQRTGVPAQWLLPMLFSPSRFSQGGLPQQSHRHCLMVMIGCTAGRVRVVTQHFQHLPDGSLQEVRLAASAARAAALPAAAAAGGKAAVAAPSGGSNISACSGAAPDRGIFMHEEILWEDKILACLLQSLACMRACRRRHRQRGGRQGGGCAGGAHAGHGRRHAPDADAAGSACAAGMCPRCD